MHVWNTEHLPSHPVSATMGFQWCWHKTVIDTKRHKETRLKPPFHFSGTVWTKVAYLHLMAVILFFKNSFLFQVWKLFYYGDFQVTSRNALRTPARITLSEAIPYAIFSYLVWNRQKHLSYNLFANLVEKKYSFFRVFGPFSGRINDLSLKKNYKSMQSM